LRIRLASLTSSSTTSTRTVGESMSAARSSNSHLTAARWGAEVRMSPLQKLLLTSALGVAAVAVMVAMSSAVADALGGAVAIAALVVVIRSAIQMAGDSGAPEEEDPTHQRLTSRT
jgi:hypothetical protein